MTCIVPSLSSHLERHVRVDTQSQEALPTLEAVLEPPVTPASGIDQQVEPAFIETLVGLGRRLRRSDGSVREGQLGGTAFWLIRCTPKSTPIRHALRTDRVVRREPAGLPD